MPHSVVNATSGAAQIKGIMEALPPLDSVVGINQSVLDSLVQKCIADAEEVAGAVDAGSSTRMLDAGGGPGLYAMAFAAAYPQLEVTLFDSAETLSEARKNIEAARLSGRIRLQSGNLLQDPLGEDYDLILASNLIHVFSVEQNELLFRRFAAAMRPDAKLCIKDFTPNDNRTDPAFPLIFAVNMLVNTPAGDTYTEEEIRGWAKAAGLRPTGRHEVCANSTILVFGRE